MTELRRPEDITPDGTNEDRITEKLRGPKTQGFGQPANIGVRERSLHRNSMGELAEATSEESDPAGRTAPPTENPRNDSLPLDGKVVDSEDAAWDQPGDNGADGEASLDHPRFVFKDRRIFTSDFEDIEEEEISSDKPSYVEQLERRVQEAEERLAEYIKAYKEKTEVEWADMKARLKKDMERQVLQAKKQMVLDLLEVLDNFGRTIASAKTAGDIQTLVTGVEMVERQFLAKLQALGLDPIDATGTTFDPSLHEAAGVQEVEDAALDGKVVEVYQQGYSFAGTLLRPALVRVAKLKKS